MRLLFIVCGAGVGLGVWLLILGLAGVDPPHLPKLTPRHPLDTRQRRIMTIRAIIAGAAGVVAGMVTGWPVGGVLAAAAAWWLPPLLGKDRQYERELAKIEAIATWTEQLRDTLSAAAGLQQAILATSTTAPEAIRADVVALCVDITGGTALPDALRAFADRLADPTGDLVVAALLQATRYQARQLADLLAALARSARAQASMRLRVATSRARVRSSARLIITVTLIVAAALVLLNPSYLTPYDSVVGQTVLAAVGAIFATAFTWLAKSGRVQPPPRIFGATAGSGHSRQVVS